jgi:hypothetical protein
MSEHVMWRKAALALVVGLPVGFALAQVGGAAVQPMISTCGPVPSDCWTYQCVDGGWIEKAPKADGTVCNDLNFCTTGDKCSNGHCVGTLKAGIDDGNPCTTDFCNPPTGVITHTPVTTAANQCCDGAGGLKQTCDDKNPCTSGDKCNAAANCTGTPLPAGSACTTAPDCTCNAQSACLVAADSTVFVYDAASNMSKRLVRASGQVCTALP